MIENHLHDATGVNQDIVLPGTVVPQQTLHRLAEVRRAKGVSCFDLARRLGVKVEEVRFQEGSADVSISTLKRWAVALDVSVTELVVEPDDWLQTTRLAKSQADRLLKLAAKLRDHSRRRSIQRLAQTFVDQLTEIHPAMIPYAGGTNYRLRQATRSRPGARALSARAKTSKPPDR